MCRSPPWSQPAESRVHQRCIQKTGYPTCRVGSFGVRSLAACSGQEGRKGGRERHAGGRDVKECQRWRRMVLEGSMHLGHRPKPAPAGLRLLCSSLQGPTKSPSSARGGAAEVGAWGAAGSPSQSRGLEGRRTGVLDLELAQWAGPAAMRGFAPPSLQDPSKGGPLRPRGLRSRPCSKRERPERCGRERRPRV
jgi:hypothetical protein